jgi:alpha-mannosidase
MLDESVMDDLAQLLGRVHERELFGHEIVSWAVTGDVFTITVGRHATTPYEHAGLRRAVLDAVAIRRGPWLVRTVAEPVITVAAQVTVPPLGRTVLTAAPWTPQAPGGRLTSLEAAPVRPGVLDNGLLAVTVAADGTLSLRDRSGREAHGVGRITDGGDVGDTYNHAPPTDDAIIDTPAWVNVEEIYSGPLVSAMDVIRGYEWPARAERDSRAEATETNVVTTRVELRAGEPYARLEISFDNRSRDHRVRWHAPAAGARESFAEGQFAVVRRGPAAEGGCGEEPVPTFPAYGFVAAGGLAVLLEHVTEYELVPRPESRPGPGDRELALTLVRSVGYLSRNQNAYRDEPAGPQVPTPAAQCLERLTMRCAVHLYEGTWAEAGLPRLAEEYRHELLAVPGSGDAAAFGYEEGLSIGGDGVIMAALRERDGRLEVRLVAEHPVATEAVLRGGFATARLANALGEPTAPLEVTGGTARLPLRPFEIATVQLSRDDT